MAKKPFSVVLISFSITEACGRLNLRQMPPTEARNAGLKRSRGESAPIEGIQSKAQPEALPARRVEKFP